MLDDDLLVLGAPHRLIRLPTYLKALRHYRKLEPHLDEAVLQALTQDLEGGELDEIQGTGGWVKGRVGSPSRRLGKRGGFRVIYLCLRVQQDIYLQTVYDHRRIEDVNPNNRRELKNLATQLKKNHPMEA